VAARLPDAFHGICSPGSCNATAVGARWLRRVWHLGAEALGGGSHITFAAIATTAARPCVQTAAGRAQGEVEARVLGAIEQIALIPEAVEYVIDKVVEKVHSARQNAPDRYEGIEKEIELRNWGRSTILVKWVSPLPFHR